MADIFTGSLAGVQAFLKTFLITDVSKPAADEVTGFISEMDGRVSARLGTFATLALDRRGVFTQAGRALVHLGAAAMTYDAATPESVRNGGNYGDTLWARWYLEVDALTKAAQQARDDAAAGSDVTGIRRVRTYGKNPVVQDNMVW